MMLKNFLFWQPLEKSFWILDSYSIPSTREPAKLYEIFSYLLFFILFLAKNVYREWAKCIIMYMGIFWQCVMAPLYHCTLADSEGINSK